jgi:hypothetical protein
MSYESALVNILNSNDSPFEVVAFCMRELQWGGDQGVCCFRLEVFCGSS